MKKGYLDGGERRGGERNCKLRHFSARIADLMGAVRVLGFGQPLKIDLNEFRVAVWNCKNTPWHAGGRGERLRGNKTPITRDWLCICRESVCPTDCVFCVVL